MQADFTGIISSGNDLTGIFGGGTNVALDGQPFFLSMIYVTHAGTRTTVPGQSDSVTGRGVAITQKIAVNGGSIFDNTYDPGTVTASAPAWSFAAQQTLQNVFRKMQQTLTVSVSIIDALAGLPTSLNTPFQQTASGPPGSLGSGALTYFGFYTDTGATYLNTTAAFNLTGVTVTMLQPDPPPPPAPVPLPATGALLGLGVLGLWRARRRG